MLQLNVGAGTNLLPPEDGWVNIDVRKLPGIQKVLDLEIHDLPYDDNAVDHVHIQEFLEYLGRFRQVPFMQNVYDVLKPCGTVYIQVPDLGVLSKLYCNVLENPSKKQGRLTAEELADALYGGQDYTYNFRSWGYDEQSLTNLLDTVGFSVHSVRSDGGHNLHCEAMKPPSTVYLPFSGGLGDILLVYLSNPVNDNDNNSTCDPITSMWLRRLNTLKQKRPEQKVKVILGSHSPFAKDLFEYHPYIDEVITVPWHQASEEVGRENGWDDAIDDAVAIRKVYATDFFANEGAVVYMSEEETKTVDKIINAGKYIVVHPFAGSKRRLCYSHSKYRLVIDALVDAGYNVVVVGASYKQVVEDNVGKEFHEHFSYKRKGVVDLVNQVSVRVSINLILNAEGFIGTHSSMLLSAWHKGIKSVCIVPPIHDTEALWEEFFDSDNPTTWGADKPFNQTFIVRSDTDDFTKEIMEFIDG